MCNDELELYELGFYFSYKKGNQVIFSKDDKTNLHIDLNTGKFLLTGSLYWVSTKLVLAVENEFKAKKQYDDFGAIK